VFVGGHYGKQLKNPIITDGLLERQIDAPSYSFQVNFVWHISTLGVRRQK
jgi:hypothetical protein